MTAEIIQQLEEDLARAMRTSDVNLLERLLAPDLLFTNHLGHVMTRDQDLEGHRNGQIQIEKLEISDLRILPKDGFALTNCRTRIAGHFNGHYGEADLRFSRVWQQLDADSWQLILAQSTQVLED